MSSQVRVGIFTILALAGAVAVYYLLEHSKHAGYDIGVHFKNTAGLQTGSAVQLAGVDVGVVSDVRLLKDQTAVVICNINDANDIYKESAFIITTTLTGQSSVQIYPPKDLATATKLPHEIQAEADMPRGSLPPSLADLASEGEQRLHSLDATIGTVNRELPKITEAFYQVANHTNRLVLHTDATLSVLSSQLESTVGELNRVVAASGSNLQEMSASANQLIQHNHKRIDTLLENLTATSASARQSMQVLASITSDPSLKKNMLATAESIAQAADQIRAIATDVHGITGDPGVQSNLKGAIGNLSSAIARANELLGNFASDSGEPRQDRGAQPQTLPSPAPIPTASDGSRASVGAQSAAYRKARRSLSLVQTSIRETWGTSGGGPSSDVNLSLLPGLRTHATIGANDLGYHTTYNLLIDSARWHGLTLSGGILYSTLGLKAVVDPNGLFALDARLYDAKHPKFDLYGDVRLSERLRLFYGERNALFNNSQRMPSFGLELKN
ncbi:MAG TPA: MlaD family protein [Candidatus Eremiobacteraceae bacterium]|nr:MlaD family protein [Candidatus Eremiobacteraceae bacterium]